MIQAEEKNICVSCNSTDPCQKPLTQKSFSDFLAKIGFWLCVFRKINCFVLFSFYFWTARSYSDCSITCKFVIKHNCKIRINFMDQHLHWLLIVSLPNLITFFYRKTFFSDRPTLKILKKLHETQIFFSPPYDTPMLSNIYVVHRIAIYHWKAIEPNFSMKVQAVRN